MTISGVQATTAATFPVEDPATNEVIAHVPECTDAQMDQAMRAAEEAYQLWRQDRKLRQAALEQLAVATEARLEELAATITSEEGKPLGEARSELSDAVNDLRGTSPHSSSMTRSSGRTAGRPYVWAPPDRPRGRHHAVELPAGHGGGQDRTRPSRPGARWCLNLRPTLRFHACSSAR